MVGKNTRSNARFPFLAKTGGSSLCGEAISSTPSCVASSPCGEATMFCTTLSRVKKVHFHKNAIKLDIYRLHNPPLIQYSQQSIVPVTEFPDPEMIRICEAHALRNAQELFCEVYGSADESDKLDEVPPGSPPRDATGSPPRDTTGSPPCDATGGCERARADTAGV